MKHKITLFTIVLFVTTSLFAQKFDGYKYVVVEPLVYQNGSTDPFGVMSTLQNAFTKYGFIVLDNDSKNWNTELRLDPCPILFCYSQHNIGTSVFAPFKVTII